jgi:hypothetical protein
MEPNFVHQLFQVDTNLQQGLQLDRGKSKRFEFRAYAAWLFSERAFADGFTI